MGASPLRDDPAVPAVRPEQSLAAAKAGDAAALRSIYEAHAAAITRRLTHMSGDPELARDVTQDAFVTAFARLDRFRGEASLTTWLHAIAYNHLRDRRKRLRRERSLWQRWRKRGEGTSAPEGQIESRSELARLQDVLAELDHAKRDAFVLRVVEQLSLEESAEILGVRVATVSYRARKAEALVREAFEKGTES